MDYLLTEVMKNFQSLPEEHKILWADNIEKNKIYGMVITDTGIF